ncbi:MAG: hypothetical protein EU533_01680 [Promethearchaeota archaeon]|nr:MAG: hypothetical protein EU533_01680 [Candidatus Lokiarchaeota archaeon]
MSKGFKLLRVEYLFSVIIPCLLAIYLNEIELGEQIWILSGFAFYAITGNTLNDVIDMKNPAEKETLDRIKGYSRKEIFVLSISSFALGSSCFINRILVYPVLGIYLIIIVLMVIFYCMFKSLLIINHIILGISHIILPYFMVKINAGITILTFFPEMSFSEWLIILSIATLAYTGQLLHEMIDGDSVSRLNPRSSQLVIWISSIISLILGIFMIIYTQYYIFFPIIIFPMGIMYIFRKPRTDLLGRYSLKDVGIIMGNLVFFYLIVLIFAS